ncbi:hypothetical protein GCM10009647_031160 [Streptomyces sanglieri]|uniref:Uncharacterized protein n=1 Tax=Streptomyces sanglieri TaxID=193460 RepID=A0ABW2WYH0_9ACTN
MPLGIGADLRGEADPDRFVDRWSAALPEPERPARAIATCCAGAAFAEGLRRACTGPDGPPALVTIDPTEAAGALLRSEFVAATETFRARPDERCSTRCPAGARATRHAWAPFTTSCWEIRGSPGWCTGRSPSDRHRRADGRGQRGLGRPVGEPADLLGGVKPGEVRLRGEAVGQPGDPGRRRPGADLLRDGRQSAQIPGHRGGIRSAFGGGGRDGGVMPVQRRRWFLDIWQGPSAAGDVPRWTCPSGRCRERSSPPNRSW